jgi:hypothetical protein
MSIDEKIVGAFSSLYRGRTDAWGGIEGRANKLSVTEANYRAHLEAKVSLGVYMLLDDGTCHFAAIDLDEKIFENALAIKNELKKLNIPAYISASRSKGYHVSVYAETFFVAKDIRRILANVLTTLKMSPKTEIFPKQDKLDKKLTPFGNYINLPCFGFERPYLAETQKEIGLAVAMSHIKRVPASVIADVIKTRPEPEPTPAAEPSSSPAKNKRGPKPKHPPCVQTILQGVQQGARDEAAFALARHYLDMQYTEDEVMALLREWDKKNTPPFNDEKQLETKLHSAQKGYAFGCNSIKNGILSANCVGEDHCIWLQENIKDKRKKGFLKDTTFLETPDYLYEECAKGTETTFIAYHRPDGVITKQNSIEMPDGISWVPVMDTSITEGAILLPDGIDEYGDTLKLVAEIREHIHKFVDMTPPSKEEFAAWYVLMTWVADRLRTVGYYRFMGDTGTGKSRALDVVGRLCYKPMMLSGAVTPAPIYRLIRRFRGTLVMDEADFNDSTEKSEVVTILNCGFEKGRPIIRCAKDDPNTLEILPCFGPKVFASRYTFDDVALEARCISAEMEETERDDIISILDDTYFAAEMKLRNKLLLWRFHHYSKVKYNDIRDIDLGKLEPRMKQTSLPYALMFKDLPEVMERFKEFIHRYQDEIKETRSESEQGRIIYAIFALATEQGKNYVSAGMITGYINEKFKMDITAQRIGKIIKSLHLKSTKRRYQGKQQHYIDWNNDTMRKIYRRYTVDPDEFKELFAGDPAFEGNTKEKEAESPDLDLEV